MVRLVKRDPKANATDITNHAKQYLGLKISQRTAQRILRRAKIFARHPASKPMLSKIQKKARLDFARKYQHWSNQEWGKILLSEETKFNLHNPDGGQFVHRPINKRFESRYVRSTLKFGAGSVIAWVKQGVLF